jgi:hypothetical protein
MDNRRDRRRLLIGSAAGGALSVVLKGFGLGLLPAAALAAILVLGVLALTTR